MKTCNECGAHDAPSIPYIAYESAKARDERNFRRLWVVILVLIGLLFGTNAAWLWYESQSQSIEISQEYESGYNNFIGNDGDIFNGETDDKIPCAENK